MSPKTERMGRTRKEFENMAKMNEYLGEAYHTLEEISADEQKRLEYEAREKALKDYNTQMQSAKNRGIKQGREQFSRLIASLARQNRMDDIIRVTEDEEYQEKLLMELEGDASEI